MLSIRFDNAHEWFVSASLFDRLFESAVASGHVPTRLADWQHVANANGGLGIDLVEPQDDRAALATGLCDAARAELSRLTGGSLSPEDESYRVSLERFLSIAP
jgi:hypothetical protein